MVYTAYACGNEKIIQLWCEKDMKCSIVIPNYNGEKSLPLCLPSVIKAAAYGNFCNQVIVVDDRSQDRSVKLISGNYKDIELICLPENRGFGLTANAGIQAAKNDIVVLLTNDCSPHESILSFLLPYFNDHDVFSVGCLKLKPDGSMDDARKVPRLVLGRIKFDRQFAHVLDEQSGSPTFYVGAFGAFCKDKFLKLGGFHDLYLPFFWEDVDLCYRAMKRGWKVLYEPKAVLYHYHDTHSSIKLSYAISKYKVIRKRNELIFFWINITGVFMRIQHVSFVIVRICFSWLFDPLFYVAFLKAVRVLPAVLKVRKCEERARTVTDACIFRLFR